MSDRHISEGTRAVFFDAVGTVLIPDPDVTAVYAEAATRFGLSVNPTAILERFRGAYRREDQADARTNWATSEAREVERWRAIVQATLPGAPGECFDWLFQHFSRPESWRVPDDVPTVLRRLDRRGIRLGLASNYDSRLEYVLAGRGELASLAGLVVISSRIGVRKPGAAFFEWLVNLIGCRPDEIVLVGDDYDNDYMGATAAGLRAVLLDPKGSHPEVDGRVESLTDVVV